MKVITESLKGNFDNGWGLLLQLIDICPDSVWSKKAGGFLFWQQIYHCFACVDIFIMPKGSAFDNPVAQFKTEPKTHMSKDEVRKFAAEMKGKADAWLASLDDAALSQTHEGISERFGSTLNNIFALSIMSGHSMYHVGSCDAILRDNGQKGVM